MQTVNRLDVLIGGLRVGTLAAYDRYRTAFEYDSEWLRIGYSISPFSLPLESGVKIAEPAPFEGLHGVFADSLPDGWGRLLMDRMLLRMGERPEELSALQRLSMVGNSGKGALEYSPAAMSVEQHDVDNLDRLAAECARVLEAEDSDAGDLDELFALGGSSGGARPKVLTRIDGEDWIIKFPSSADPVDIGMMEYEYTECARNCGIEVPVTRLFPSQTCKGYFGSKRFDRCGKKIHMASASALLEVSHRVPALDYKTLMSLTWQLTKKEEEIERMYRVMCFNVFAHNRDDHSNNFTFLCEEGNWSLSPAYDLTYSNSIGGEHATTINGEGKNPSLNDILAVAKVAGIKESRAKDIANEIKTRVEKDLDNYLM